MVLMYYMLLQKGKKKSAVTVGAGTGAAAGVGVAAGTGAATGITAAAGGVVAAAEVLQVKKPKWWWCQQLKKP